VKNLMLVVCLAVVAAGCGSAAASSSSTAESFTMQGGQWEYVVTPENGGTTMYFGTNVPTSNSTFGVNNVAIFQPSQVSLMQNTGPVACETYTLNGKIDGTKIEGQFDTPSGEFASFSGQLSADGKSISDGKYSGLNCGSTSKIKGTLTGYTVAPLNGTFTGTLTSNTQGSDVVTITFTQNPDKSVGIAGTFVEKGVTTSFVGMTGDSAVLIAGASIFFGANTANVNGSSQFSAMGHSNPTATQFTLEINGPNEGAVGTLKKQ
jgi:hypothetical protein